MKSLITIWKEKGNILEGIKNSIFSRQDVEIIAEARMNVCEGCEHLDTKGGNCLVPGTQPCCAKCGCKLGWKTRSLASECPVGKWKAEVSQEEEDMINKNLGLTD
jgi:hypothetical protein